jgi:hypothetical protein
MYVGTNNPALPSWFILRMYTVSVAATNLQKKGTVHPIVCRAPVCTLSIQPAPTYILMFRFFHLTPPFSARSTSKCVYPYILVQPLSDAEAPGHSVPSIIGDILVPAQVVCNI